MSSLTKIKALIKRIESYNHIPLKDFTVTHKLVTDTRRNKKTPIFEIKLYFKNIENLIDYKLIFSNFFEVKYKVYRKIDNVKENSYSFCIKRRNREALEGLTNG